MGPSSNGTHKNCPFFNLGANQVTSWYISITSIGQNVGLNDVNGLNSNTLNPRSFILVRGKVSKSPCSFSPINICQSTGILIVCLPIFITNAGALNDSKKINGI